MPVFPIKVSEATGARRRRYFTGVDIAAPRTRVTGWPLGSFYPYVSKNGAAPVAGAGTLGEISSTTHKGVYYYEFTATEVNTLGYVTLVLTPDRGVLSGLPYYLEPREYDIPIVSWDPWDAVRGGMTALPNANAAAAGGLPIIGTGAGGIGLDGAGNVSSAVKQWLTTAVTLSGGKPDVNVFSITANAITAAAINAAAITAAKFATGAVDANALATDAAQEIRDSIWNAVLSSYATAGTTGKKLADLASGGDATAANQTTIIGLVDTVESMLATIAAYIDTEVAAIKAKTDNLPADPAGMAALAAAHGAGSWEDAGGSLTAQDVVDALNADEHRAGHTFLGLRRRLDAFIKARATGLNGPHAKFFQPGSTVDVEFETDVDPTNGTRAHADISGSET